MFDDMLRTITEPRLERLQRSFVEAIFDRDAMPLALQYFADFCDATIGHLMVADGNRTLLQSTFSVEVDPDLAELEAQLQHVNPRVSAIPKMKALKSTRDKDFITREEISKDLVYQELILPLGLGHFSAVPIINSPTLTGGVALHRPMSDEAFDSSEATRHELAAAVCAPVFELASMVENSRAKSSVDLFGPTVAAAAVKRTGVMIECNCEFDRQLQAGVVTTDANSQVRFAHSANNEQLHQILNDRTTTVGGSFVVKNADGAAEYVASIVPVPSIGIMGGASGAAVVLIKPIHKVRRLNVRLVKEAFGFTPAETETAELLVQGKTVTRINEIRGVSVHTTQTLIKRILTKAECSRQVELMTLLSPFLD
tara:strand:- start:122 stop:1228 length:1107 start_codon:yes stop_codon:yes gene_type:complete